MVCKLRNAESLQTYSVTAEGLPFAFQGSHETSLHQYAPQRASYIRKNIVYFHIEIESIHKKTFIL